MLTINRANNNCLSALVLLLFFSPVSLSDQDNVTKALLSFKSNSDTTNSLSSWVNSSDPCSGSWLGVSCDSVTGRVTRLVLENLGLNGSVKPLSQLADLRLLSLKNNSLWSTDSSLDLSAWPNLKHLYLSHNRFAGNFPTGVSTLRRLLRLDLSHNGFSGEIPVAEVARLPRLLTLRLESNRFDGGLGDSSSSVVSPVSDFNVSGNNLSGEIPEWLKKFDATSFGGNNKLCGKPLPHDQSCRNSSRQPGEAPPAVKNNKGSNRSVAPPVVVAAVAAAAAVATAVAAAVLVYCRRRRKRSARRSQVRKGSGSHGAEVVMFEGCRKGIGGSVEELFRGSAEMLGKGSTGTTYKVVVDGGDPVVVKRAKSTGMRPGKEVDWWLRQVVGKLRHQNIASLRGYHRSENHNLLLLIYDYFPAGSLHHLLHGNRGPGRTPVDWATRLKLASDSARGLSFLHDYHNDRIKLFHGKFSSANVLIDQSGNAYVADVGLRQLFRGAGPELSTRKYTQKCDVYRFGAVLLEILTGKMTSAEEEERSLAAACKECGTGNWQVLDVEILRNRESEEGILGLMQVAMLCLAPSPEDRPAMSEVYRMIEDIRTKGVDC